MQQRRLRQIAASIAPPDPPRQSPELIPIRYEERSRLLDSDWAFEHLRWMIQKDALGQDMFLLGPHSPLRRWLAYRFCEISGARACIYAFLTFSLSGNVLATNFLTRARGTLFAPS